MVLAKARLLLVAGALLLPHVAGDPESPSPPSAVFAVSAGTAGTLVYWTPVGQASASYRVYGVSGESYTLLETTSVASALVAGGYTNYAVSSVVGGTESARTLALSGVCVSFIPDPPYVAVRTNCATGVYGGIMVPRPNP